jgi:hypothetical protein
MGHDVRAWYMGASDRNLYVSGSFDEIGGVPARNIAAFDGTNWRALGSGLDDAAWPIKAVGSRVICGGIFTRAGGESSYHLAVWHEPAAPR